MRATTLDDDKQRILRVMLHVQDHLDDPLDLSRLGDVAAFSPRHFYRVFKGLAGPVVVAADDPHARLRREERLRLGPYDREHETSAAMQAFAAAEGLTFHGR